MTALKILEDPSQARATGVSGLSRFDSQLTVIVKALNLYYPARSARDPADLAADATTS